MPGALSSALTTAGLSLLATVVAVLISVVIAVLTGRFPNRSRKHPERIRMPRVVLVAGLASTAIGLWVGLAAGDARYPPGMRIASILLMVLGMVALVAYAAWYIEPGPEEIISRTSFGWTRRIAYAEIASYRFTEINGQRIVSLVSSDGTSLSVSTVKYDVSPLLAAIEFREARGRWPLRGELTVHPI